jgi:methionyl-tRNA synthetase
VKYCVGCELEKTECELIEGHCPLHPNKEIEMINEENYFFRFSHYQQPLLDLFTTHPRFVEPESKMKEIVAFVKGGLQDFSISRLKEKMPWGIEVPNDPNQVMYVWFDALINYISTLGWPDNKAVFEAFWPGVQIAGKDNLRQQSTMWQAMLLSAGLPPSKQILINGFISVEDQKMSKSVGNVITPIEMIARYGVDGTRYLLLALGPISTDMNVTYDQFNQKYNGFLANSLGNTIQRVATMADRSGMSFGPETQTPSLDYIYNELQAYRFDAALTRIWDLVGTLEKQIDEAKPWTLTGEALYQFLTRAISQVRSIGTVLSPFMPETSQRITSLFTGPTIPTPQSLFPRLTMS